MQLTLKRYGKNHPMTFYTSTYAKNGNLYVGLATHIEGYPAPWSDLTVNLSVKCQENCAFIDTNNNQDYSGNGDDIIDWLESNGLGKRTGRMQISGFCVYPEFEFNMEKLKEYIEE